jgi:ribosomal protein S18 acetylase RimI-like enzyme
VIIRPYQPEDRAACLALFDSNVPDDFRPEERPELEGFLTTLPGPYLVVEDGAGEVVAAGGYAREPGTRTATMCWGMVSRERQGEGIGRALLLERLRRVRLDPEVAMVALHTSHRVRGFYERLGFVAERVIEDGLAPGLHRVDMRLVVDGAPR